MTANGHTFHIPVMGTGHSIDTPIRVGPFGISSVVSLVDDLLLERIRRHYAAQANLPFQAIPRSAADGRALRITAFLDLLDELVHRRFAAIQAQPFFAANDKRSYFELLPEASPLKQDYLRLLTLEPGPARDELARELTARMQPGSSDVNIMVKLDRTNYNGDGEPLDESMSDAKAALRGFARSRLCSGIVLSAGINQALISYMTGFREFYREASGEARKRIILKVSDFRSAQIQGKFLARKGLEVWEYRIESGLNCGGHAFATDGHLLPCLLKEFQEQRERLAAELRGMVQRHYAAMGWPYPAAAAAHRPRITVQGGIGTHGEVRRLLEGFGLDGTGWASPFLLVPEATCVDAETRELLRQAGGDALYLSEVSPLGVPFNNAARTGSERWTQRQAASGTPGSPCPKGFLVSNTEFTERPICVASREYQGKKLAEIDGLELPEGEKASRRAAVLEKTCLCDHLGNGALIALGLVEPTGHPQAICPGPNLAWFNRVYSLREMVDHIYGRGASLVPPERPHMFAAEIVMYVDYFKRLVSRCSLVEPKARKLLETFRANLEAGMDYCLSLAEAVPFPGENLASIRPCVEAQRARLQALVGGLDAAYEVGGGRGA